MRAPKNFAFSSTGRGTGMAGRIVRLRNAVAVACVLPALVAADWVQTDPIPGIGPTGEIQRLATGFVFAEGPATDSKGNLYFSEIGKDRILRYESPDTVSPVIENLARTNGLMFANDGRLLACDAGHLGRKGVGRVIAIDLATQSVEVVAGEYQGGPFNRLNDLVVDRTGGIYFTDALEGLPGLPQDSMAVYYVSRAGTVTRLVDDLERPNGLILSPDESTLYVLPAMAPVVMQFPVLEPGRLGAGKPFCDIPFEKRRRPYGGDGLTVDAKGNVYVAVPSLDAILVLNPQGETLGRIALPESPINCTFGGPDRKTLYVTAPKSLFSVPMEVEGHRFAVQGDSSVP